MKCCKGDERYRLSRPNNNSLLPRYPSRVLTSRMMPVTLTRLDTDTGCVPTSPGPIEVIWGSKPWASGAPTCSIPTLSLLICVPFSPPYATPSTPGMARGVFRGMGTKSVGSPEHPPYIPAPYLFARASFREVLGQTWDLFHQKNALCGNPLTSAHLLAPHHLRLLRVLSLRSQHVFTPSRRCANPSIAFQTM